MTLDLRWNARLMISFLLSAWLLVFSTCTHQPAYACDSEFIQEPTYTTPSKDAEEDTIAGLIRLTYEFPDGTILVVVYQLRDLLSDPEPFPLFYHVKKNGHPWVTYIDPEVAGNCYSIHRY